jgi:hypothetical protein
MAQEPFANGLQRREELESDAGGVAAPWKNSDRGVKHTMRGLRLLYTEALAANFGWGATE